MSRAGVRVVLALLAWNAAVLTSAAVKGDAPRCHGLPPICRGLGQRALCVCPNKYCANHKCRWICGELGGVAR